MRKPEQAPEPSIEEILASIRRIIADDTPAAGDMDREEAIAPVHHQAEPARRPMPVGQRRQPGREDEVLELTEDYMLAEEAATVTLQEPREPEEIGGGELSRHGHYRDPFSARGGDDPYDDSAMQQRAPHRAERAAEPVHHTDPDPEPEVTTEGLANVMAEVQRFVDAGKPAEAPTPAAARPLDNWTQPQNDVFRSDPTPRPPTRWSARHASADPAKAPEAASARSAAREEPPLFRKPSLPDRESWSQGIQMPVPDDGPGIPYATDDSAEPAAGAPASFGSEAPVEWSAPPLEQITGDTRGREPSVADDEDDTLTVLDEPESRATPSEEVQARAEKLAEKAVSDFASDKLNAEAPVAAFLKSDKPLMEEITGTLADALAKVGPAIEEAKDRLDAPDAPAEAKPDAATAASGPALDEKPVLLEEAGGPPAVELSEPGPAAPELARKPATAEKHSEPESDADSFAPDLPAAADMPNLDGGFMPPEPPLAPMPLHARVDPLPQPEAPELPREDGDDGDLSMMPLPPQLDEPIAAPRPAALRPAPAMSVPQAGAPKVVAPSATAALSRAMALPTAGAAREVGGLQGAVTAPRSLEDTVREMLRPMLAQWLNENMPRILNDAIREELAAAGIRSPRQDDDRR